MSPLFEYTVFLKTQRQRVRASFEASAAAIAMARRRGRELEQARLLDSRGPVQWYVYADGVGHGNPLGMRAIDGPPEETSV